MNKNYKLTIADNCATLNFEQNDKRYKCKLHLETEAWAELEVWDEDDCGFALDIYRHINDLLFCTLYTKKAGKSVEVASFIHSVGNLFDTDNKHWTTDQKVQETIDSFVTLVEEQLELYKKL